jgi:hypothetical protein
MNICYDEHHPMYKITYKPNHYDELNNEWFVCEKCFGKQEFFGAVSEIESIVSLHNYQNIGLEINHLDIMTRTISRKLKKSLLIT